MCVKWRGCSKILTQPYGVLQISGCAHGVQLLLQTQQTPLCALEEGAAMSQPPDCHTGAGCHTQGAGNPLGAPGQPGPGCYKRCRCSPESQNHRRRAHTGGLAHPTPPSPPQLICQLQVGVRQAASSSGAWDGASRPSLEQHVGHRAWERPGPRQEGLEILQKQDLEHMHR